MAVIYLKHPKHGTKVACSEEEAAYDAKSGWERFTLSASVSTVAEPKPSETLTAPDELQTLRVQYKEKFGKIPHHKKSAATLRTELAS